MKLALPLAVFQFDIPHLGSLILTHSWDGEIQGLKQVPPRDRPYVPIVFFAFRAMVGIGLALFSLSILGAYLRWRRHLFTERWFLIALVTRESTQFSRDNIRMDRHGGGPPTMGGVWRFADC
jgi:cytochrome bd-type quinol oxidase subunit 1